MRLLDLEEDVVPQKKATIFIPRRCQPSEPVLDGLVFNKGCFYASIIRDFDRDGEVVTVDGPHHIVEPIIHALMELVRG